jgi:hypothetical protein
MGPSPVIHDNGCRVLGAHSDAAKRASDAVNLHVIALGFGAFRKWVAVALADGRSDGELYDSKRDAVRHQRHNEDRFAFVRITPNGMTVCRAESYLGVHRKLAAAGFRLADPDAAHGGRQVIPRLTNEDQAQLMARLRR